VTPWSASAFTLTSAWTPRPASRSLSSCRPRPASSSLLPTDRPSTSIFLPSPGSSSTSVTILLPPPRRRLLSPEPAAGRLSRAKVLASARRRPGDFRARKSSPSMMVPLPRPQLLFLEPAAPLPLATVLPDRARRRRVKVAKRRRETLTRRRVVRGTLAQRGGSLALRDPAAFPSCDVVAPRALTLSPDWPETLLLPGRLSRAKVFTSVPRLQDDFRARKSLPAATASPRRVRGFLASIGCASSLLRDAFSSGPRPGAPGSR